MRAPKTCGSCHAGPGALRRGCLSRHLQFCPPCLPKSTISVRSFVHLLLGRGGEGLCCVSSPAAPVTAPESFIISPRCPSPSPSFFLLPPTPNNGLSRCSAAGGGAGGGAGACGGAGLHCRFPGTPSSRRCRQPRGRDPCPHPGFPHPREPAQVRPLLSVSHLHPARGRSILARAAILSSDALLVGWVTVPALGVKGWVVA